MWNNQLGRCVLGRYQCGNKIQLEEEKVEEKGEEVEDGDDVRRSPWLNLVIRASGGVGMGWWGGYWWTGISVLSHSLLVVER